MLIAPKRKLFNYTLTISGFVLCFGAIYLLKFELQFEETIPCGSHSH